MDSKERAEHIKKHNPFHNIMRVKEVIDLSASNARSGESFKVIATDGKQYKIRYAGGLLKARHIEKTVNRFPHLFAKFYGRDGRYLMFRWEEGRDMKKTEDLDNIEKVGEIYGELHEFNERAGSSKSKAFFDNMVRYLVEKKLINRRYAKELFGLYKRKTQGMTTDAVLELSDVHAGNFMVKKDGRVIIIDEEGVNHKLKGLGLAKGFMHFFSPEQKEAFMRGYRRKHRDDYLTRDYRDFLTFYFLVRDVYVKHYLGNTVPKVQKTLDNLNGYMSGSKKIKRI